MARLRFLRILLIVTCWTCVPTRGRNIVLHLRPPPRPRKAAGAPTYWQVSNYGRCRAPNGRVTCGSRRADGYLLIRIRKRNWLVHRLVQLVFRGPPREQHRWQVNHLDRNTSNNRLDNLEYATAGENLRHSYKTTSRGTAGLKTSMAVRCKAVHSNSWTAYAPMTKAAKALGMSKSSVSKSCAKTWW